MSDIPLLQCKRIHIIMVTMAMVMMMIITDSITPPIIAALLLPI